MVMEKFFLFETGVTNASEEEILEYILLSLEKNREKYYIVTPNPEILVYAVQHKSFKNILNHARLALCDGLGVILAGKILGKNFKGRVTGVDLMEKLCKEASKRPITVGFLGGGPKIAERAAECLQSKYPGLKVGFVAEEWPKDGKKTTDYRLQTTAVDGRQKTVDILFVAFGFPKQEEWIAERLDKIPVRIAMCVGGAFDYISGAVPRAPLLIRLIGFEWLFRLIRQPWRIKRQLALVEFIWIVLKEKFKI